MNARRRLLLGAAALSGAFATTRAWSQDWPTGPVKLVVPFPPGGASDIAARLLAPLLAEALGVAVMIDNKPGGGASIGARLVATAPADGQTLLMSNSASSTISPFVLAQGQYDALGDFTHVFYIGAVPTVFVVHPSLPVTSFGELIHWIRAQPQPVQFGSGGVASVAHVVGELFAREAGLALEHIPYKGSAPMRNDLIGGQILLAVDALPQNLPYLNSGELRLLAVTSAQRVPQAPSLASVAELGYPALVAENFVGISGPRGLDPAVAGRLYTALDTMLRRDDLRQRLQELGFVLDRKSPAEFADFVSDQIQAWQPIVRHTGAAA